MTWLFSKAMMKAYGNSLSSQEQVAEYSGASCLDGEPSAQLNVMPTPHKFWRNDKTMEFSKLSQFGLTLRLLTEQDGEALLTSYLADFPAKTLALPAKALGSRAKEVERGRRWRGSFAKYSQDSCSWKTAQLSLLEGSGEFLETWPRWGSMRNGESYLRQIPELFTCEKEYGYWPTPTRATAHKEVVTSQGCNNLVAFVKMFPTPTATEGKGAPTLEKVKARALESKRGVRLCEHIARDGVPGQLNPTWVEWLMGWILDWTDLKPLAMDRFLEWQQQHSISYAKDWSEAA
jgi:hypothetical protein